MDDLLTIKQVAIILKIHPLSVRRYIIQGKLKAIKIGGNVRVSQNDLKDFSHIYVPNSTQLKKEVAQSTVSQFSPSDSLFRLKGRGLSINNFDK
jgi:excisionase family DNA binding protein